MKSNKGFGEPWGCYNWTALTVSCNCDKCMNSEYGKAKLKRKGKPMTANPKLEWWVEYPKGTIVPDLLDGHFMVGNIKVRDVFLDRQNRLMLWIKSMDGLRTVRATSIAYPDEQRPTVHYKKCEKCGGGV